MDFGWQSEEVQSLKSKIQGGNLPGHFIWMLGLNLKD